ncbi:MAG: GAF domain-containing protein [Verrucomicrobia bacterium]|nr:MAG: GAF domain-containing protein [Verrucomicrobiota bacterium]
MLNLLVITAHNKPRDHIASLLAETGTKLTFRRSTSDASALVERGVFDAILLVAPGASEHALDELRHLRRLSTTTPVAVLVDAAPLPWEETALHIGADIIFREPVSAPHIERTLARLAAAPAAPATPPNAIPPTQPAPTMRGSLEILRDFSHLLGYSLDRDRFAEQFVHKIRDIIGVSRIAVFLEDLEDCLLNEGGRNRLRCTAAVGVPPDIIECFELSPTVGIGARMLTAPQVLLANSAALAPSLVTDQKIEREFEIMGCVVAIPISDRTRTVGVAMLGPHVTGRLFTQEELQLLFLLMEELGSAIRNSRLHRQVSSSHRLLTDVLATLSSGCLVINEQLRVLHANRAMLRFIKGEADPAGPLEFADLPSRVADPLYDTLIKNVRVEPFTYTDTRHGERVFRATIIPLGSDSGRKPETVMLVLEDFTQIEAAKKTEIEASKARLIALIAKRFAHEIRNSLVPLATHEQLLDSEYQSDDFRRSLKTALSRETSRIQRFTEQMLYLAQPPRTPAQTANIRDLVETCFQRAADSLGIKGKLHLRSEQDLPLVRCHQPALEHALQEIFTNALQANPESPEVTVTIAPANDDGISIGFRDSGKGFDPETVERVLEPFFTTRNTGIGLGLTVARKIIDDHHGTLNIAPRSPTNEHDVAIWLPAAASL